LIFIVHFILICCFIDFLFSKLTLQIIPGFLKIIPKIKFTFEKNTKLFDGNYTFIYPAFHELLIK